MPNEQWQRDREQKRQERATQQFMRRMSQPIARGEVAQFGEAQAMHIASLALAIEALEQLLIQRDLLQVDELINLMKALAEQKQQQMAAAQASSNNLIAEV